MTNQAQIADTIRQQILMHGISIPGSWGMRQLIAQDEMERFGQYMRGGLRFRVSGRHFRGIVIVWLNSMDLYTVEFAQIRRGTLRTVRRIDNVYFDNLTGAIDGYVETAAA